MSQAARERVTILGDGAMATVCSILLTQGGHEVTMWGAFEESIERLIQNREQSRLLPGVRIPAGVRLTTNDDDCFNGATIILSAIPTQYMRSVWSRLATRVPNGLPVASVLTALTMLETRGLVVGAYGRYRPAGRLAGSEPARPKVR